MKAESLRDLLGLQSIVSTGANNMPIKTNDEWIDEIDAVDQSMQHLGKNDELIHEIDAVDQSMQHLGENTNKK
jgi:hypothetical protein